MGSCAIRRAEAIGPKKDDEEEEGGGNDKGGIARRRRVRTAVSIGTRVDGIFANLGPTESFEVVPLRTRGLRGCFA